MEKSWTIGCDGEEWIVRAQTAESAIIRWVALIREENSLRYFAVYIYEGAAENAEIWRVEVSNGGASWSIRPPKG